MNFQSGYGIMGESGKCLNTIPAHVNELDWSSPVPTHKATRKPASVCPPELVSAVIDDYISGVSARSTGAKFAISDYNVRKVLRAHGITIRPMGEAVSRAMSTPEKMEGFRLRLLGKPGMATGKRWRLSHVKSCPKTKGENNPQWKGGITPVNIQIRTSAEYRHWRRQVFQRDNWTCVLCGRHRCPGDRVILHADHIKTFAAFPELRFVVSNGRTLCRECHKKTDTYGVNLSASRDVVSAMVVLAAGRAAQIVTNGDVQCVI